MAHAEWDLWGRLEKTVQDGRYMSANEEFTALKGLVQKADASELSAQLARAPLAWEFLLAFGAKKPFYRSHLCQVVEALLAQPRWREVYASSQELQEKVADPALHADIKKALAAVPAAPAAVAVATKKAEKPRAGGPSKDVEWPSWEVLQEVVQKETFMAANEEFRVLRLAVLAADPVQLASQVAHAPMVWEFIAGFAAKKSHFRSQVVEVTNALRKERGWDEALEAAQPSLRSRINELPEAASAVRGQLSRADQSPAASGGDSSLGDVGEEEHQTPYTSPDFQSLEERLRSMMSCVANLAPDQSPGVDEGEDRLRGKEGPRNAAPAAGPSEGLREEMVSQLLEEAKTSGSEDAGRLPEAPDPQPPQEPPKKEPQAEVAPEALCLLDRAAALEADGSQPVAAHYLRIHALEMLLTAKQRGQTNAESDKLLFATFEKAEEAKARLDLSRGAEQLRHFAVQNYEQAVSADGGPADAKQAWDLLTAGLCLDALAQFGAVEPALKERAQYAKSRAEHLRSCLRLQQAPEAPQPPQQPLAPVAPAAPAAQAPVVPPPPPRAPAAPAAPDPPAAPAAPAPAAAPKAQPKPSAPPPSRPTAVVPQAQPAPVPAAGSTLSASKRQAEARKKADQAIAAVAAGSDDSARALIREAIGLLQGL
ncbi:LIP5 [Symbiodinium sp. KB8]|nr:LIP5 [Symbiodinium sp. KB8]